MNELQSLEDGYMFLRQIENIVDSVFFKRISTDSIDAVLETLAYDLLLIKSIQADLEYSISLSYNIERRKDVINLSKADQLQVYIRYLINKIEYNTKGDI